MPAVWTSPKTWATGELVTAALLNTHLRDNLEFLKAPPTTVYVLNESSDYTTTSTAFVNVDNTKLALALTTNGGDVLISFHGMLLSSSNGRVISLDVEVDGVRLGGDDGLIAAHWVSGVLVSASSVSFTVLARGLSAGNHTFKLQWKLNIGSATATLYAGAGTTYFDHHPHFWVREVS